MKTWTLIIVLYIYIAAEIYTAFHKTVNRTRIITKLMLSQSNSMYQPSV